MDVRPQQDGDVLAIGDVIEQCFEDDAAGIVEVLARLREAGDFFRGLVADVGGEVVGYVALSRAWLDAREELVDVLVLSPLGVLPAHQRGGVGTALLAAAVDAAGAAGVPLVFLEGAPGFHADRGWERASAYGIERPSVRIPDPACQVVLLPAHEPWMTGRLVYPDVWWRLDLVGLRDRVLARVEATLSRK